MAFTSKNKQKRQNTAPPKNVIMKLVPGLRKEFDKAEKRPMWMMGEKRFFTLQEAVDALYVLYPAIRPWASLQEQARAKARLAAADAEANKVEEGPIITTELYWDCECNENYIHPATEEICGSCGTSRDDQPDSRVEEVKAMGYSLEETHVIPAEVGITSYKSDQPLPTGV